MSKRFRGLTVHRKVNNFSVKIKLKWSVIFTIEFSLLHIYNNCWFNKCSLHFFILFMFFKFYTFCNSLFFSKHSSRFWNGPNILPCNQIEMEFEMKFATMDVELFLNQHVFPNWSFGLDRGMASIDTSLLKSPCRKALFLHSTNKKTKKILQGITNHS